MESGKRVPLNERPELAYELPRELLPGIEPSASPRKVWRSHFTTCPQADAWRRS